MELDFVEKWLRRTSNSCHKDSKQQHYFGSFFDKKDKPFDVYSHKTKSFKKNKRKGR